MTNMIEDLGAIVGAAQVLTGSDAAPFLDDWTGAYSGRAEAVVRPAATPEVSAIMQYAHQNRIPVMVQGGNTSVAGGSVPVREGGIVLSLGRMNRIRSIDAGARTATVDSGVVIEALQTTVAEHGLDFPLMFAARGSAQIGGALATNAGGSNVLRYGNARDLCLGIEAVLPDGRVIHGLSGLHKDNTGFDLKTLMTGAEGTLGVITGAVLKLVPTPKTRATAFLSLSEIGAALEVLNALQDGTGGLVEAFEWLPHETVQAIIENEPSIRAPLETPAETGILVELASTRADDAALAEDGTVRLQTVLLEIVEAQMEAGRVIDGMFAASEQQRRDLWTLREAVLETIRAQGPFTVLDIALPLSTVAAFVAEAAPITEAARLRPMFVGHLGDGNIHYAVNAYPGEAWDKAAVATYEERVLDLAIRMGGTFSAEHGIGRSKIGEMVARKDPAQYAMMRAIKTAVDPDGILNPGVMFGLT